MNYPRLLFITSHAFNNVTGTGITFTNLFNGWSKSKILTLHNDSIKVTNDICENYYFLENEIRYIFPFHLFFKKKVMESVNTDYKKKNVIRKIKKIIKYFKFIFLGDSFFPEKFTPTKKLKRILDDYNPEIIFTILGSNAIMDLIIWVKKIYKCKLIVHIMDDWYKIKYSSGIFSNIQRRKMKYLFDTLIKNSDLRFSISDYMAEEYKNRFKKSFMVFHNAIDTKKWSKYTSITNKKNINEIILRYIGSVYPFAQSSSLIDIVKAIDIIAIKMKIRIELFVENSCYKYTVDLLAFSSNCRVYSEISDNDIFFKTISSCDILVLPSNFDEYSINFIKYSMPTKIPAYMLSKTPILVYGSEDVAQVKYALEYKWGYCIVEKNIDKLVKGILDLLNDKIIREKYINNSYNLVFKCHDIKKVSNEFQKSICSLK